MKVKNDKLPSEVLIADDQNDWNGCLEGMNTEVQYMVLWNGFTTENWDIDGNHDIVYQNTWWNFTYFNLWQLYRWDPVQVMDWFFSTCKDSMSPSTIRHVTTHYTPVMSPSTKQSIYVFKRFYVTNIMYLWVAHHKILAVEIHVGSII
jgi:hypothetical protein